MTPRESTVTGAAGVANVVLPSVTEGRAPANASVVPMRKVAAPLAWAAVKVNLMVTGELALLKMAMGKSETAEVPTVYVRGPHDAMRVSEGCMRSWLAALRKPVG